MKIVHTLIALFALVIATRTSAQQAVQQDSIQVLILYTDSSGTMTVFSDDLKLLTDDVAKTDGLTICCNPHFDKKYQDRYYIRCQGGKFILGKLAQDGKIRPVPDVKRKFLLDVFRCTSPDDLGANMPYQ